MPAPRRIARSATCFGARDRFHDAHDRVWLEQFVRDLRYAWRGLWRSRAFCATTVLTLAVGLGLATAVFTIFNAYVLRPFAVRDPYSVYEITWHSQEAAGSTFRWSDYEALRPRTDLFEAVIAQANRFVTSQGNTLSAGFVSGNYFEALGAPVLLGRGLADYDARADGGAPVAVLGYRTWARLFDRDPAVLGREIEINDRKLVIVGVTRQEFQGLDDAPQDLWVPVTMYGPIVKSDLFAAVQPREMHLTARLRRTVTGAQAEGAVSLEPFEARVAGRLDAVRAEFSRARDARTADARAARRALSGVHRLRARSRRGLRERVQRHARARETPATARSGSVCRSARAAVA